MGFSFKKLAKRAVGVVTGKDLFDSLSGKNAAERAAGAEQAAANQGIVAQRTAQEQAQALRQPYIDAGIPALQGLQSYMDAGANAFGQQQAAIGLKGPEEQQKFIEQIESSPYMQAMIDKGEEAILQNASATGGLRGGNTIEALAQFRPEMFQNYYDQQYGRLGGLASAGLQTTQNVGQLGQAAAAGSASGALQTGANIAGLHNAIGASQAGKETAIHRGRMGLANTGLQLGSAIFTGGGSLAAQGAAGAVGGGGGGLFPGFKAPTSNPTSWFRQRGL